MTTQNLIRKAIAQGLANAQRVGRVTIRLLARLENAARLGLPLDQQGAVIRSTRYNMSQGVNEAYYLRQYLHWLLPELPTDTATPLKALDLGCGQGRLLKPILSQFPGARFDAVDISSDALAGARQHLGSELSRRVAFTTGDIGAFIETQEKLSKDLIIMNEVTFFYPEWKLVLPAIVQCLAPGGVLAISFRSLYFYGLLLTKARALEELVPLGDQRQGALSFCGNSPLSFTWQTAAEVREIFGNFPELRLKKLVAIGTASGIPGDPHASIVEPDQLNDAERQQLFDFECSLGADIPDAGRYMLAIVQKTATIGT